MKPHLLAATLPFILVAPAVCARPEAAPFVQEDFVNLLRMDLRAAKAEIVTNALELTEEELVRFWPIYQEYDQTLAKLNTERVATLRDFASHYSSIGDGQAEELTRRSLDFQRKRLDLLEKYYDRVAKSFNPATAARFLQIEHQLLVLVDVQIASELPLIPRQAMLQRAGTK